MTTQPNQFSQVLFSNKNLWSFLITNILKFARFRCRQYQLKSNEFCIVATDKGRVKGVKRTTIWKKEFFSFEKIPFAKPPIGELRFKAPRPADAWKNVLDCTTEGPVPIQQDLFRKKHKGSEDCLYINVYTRKLNPSAKLPVLIWIYGGGFKVGGSSKDFYSPDYIMDEDVVLITFNYRLGPFGFLSIDDASLDVPGNSGLKDQVLALKWVKQNCENFGGDPNNITIFGESAGAASTHYMMLNKNNKNLFHKAILLSGCGITSWAQVPPRNWPYRLAKLVGYEGEDDTKSVYEFLKSADANDLLLAEMKILTSEERKNRILFAFGPVIEPFITEDCVIPEDPLKMMRNSWSNEIPMIISGTSSEGLLFYPETIRNPKILEQLNNWEYLVPSELNLPRHSEQCQEFGLKLKSTHCNETTSNGKNQLFGYLDALSYKFFWHAITRTVTSRITYAATVPTYLLRFDFDSPDFNHVRTVFCGTKIRGTCHADDLSYIFLNAIARLVPNESKEYRMIKFMTKSLVQFAKTGNPNNEINSPVVWHPVRQINGKAVIECLNVGDDFQFDKYPEMNKLEVWNSLYNGKELI